MQHSVQWHLLSLILLLHPLHLLLVLLPQGLWCLLFPVCGSGFFPAYGITRVAPHIIGFTPGQRSELPFQMCGTAVVGQLTWATTILFLIGMTNVYTQDKQQWDHNFLDVKEPNICYLAQTPHFPGHYAALQSYAIIIKDRETHVCPQWTSLVGKTE